jgi:hypothetical protein
MYYYSLLDGVKMGKSLYISIDSKEIEEYRTLLKNNEQNLSARKILPIACRYAPPLAIILFKLKRNIYCENSLKTEYWHNWLYHAAAASEISIWKKRVDSYKGCFNHKKKMIEFPNDELFDSFYEEYEYEPDEQTLEIQNRNIPPLNQFVNDYIKADDKNAPIEKTEKSPSSWKDFYEKYKKNGIYHPDDEFLNELSQVIY